MGIILFLRFGSAGICLRRWRRGSSFIFLRCRSPYRAWLFVHFSSLPRRKTNQKEGGAKREKNSAYGLKQLFPRRETSQTASSQSARYNGYMHTKLGEESGLRPQNSSSRGGRHRKRHLRITKHKDYLARKAGKESGLRLLTAFPGVGNAGCIFYPLYKGAAGKSAGRSESICKPSPFFRITARRSV